MILVDWVIEAFFINFNYCFIVKHEYNADYQSEIRLVKRQALTKQFRVVFTCIKV